MIIPAFFNQTNFDQWINEYFDHIIALDNNILHTMNINLKKPVEREIDD